MKNIEQSVENFKFKHELFINGCDSIEEAHQWDVERLGDMDAFYTNDLASIIIRLVAVDGSISQKEVDYTNETFGFSYTLEELTEVYNSCIDDIDQSFDENFHNGISYMRKINSKLADAYKELLCLICDIIIESDGVVTPEEADEVRRLKKLCE